MNHEYFTRLLTRKLSGEATQAELDELAQFLRDNPNQQFLTELLNTYWQAGSTEPKISFEDPNNHFQHILDLADDTAAETFIPARRPVFSLKRMSIAACILIIAGTFCYVATTTKEHQVVATRYKKETPKGRRASITLQDGSTVLLNAGSTLSYPDIFNGSTREVTLEGEGYFTIVKDPAHPFIVHAKGMDIRVLGTTFNVKAYSGDKQTETSLISGSIEVTIKSRPNDKIILSPAEKLVVKNKDSAELKLLPASAAKAEIAVQRLRFNIADSTIDETEWLNDKLVFNDEDFGQVLAKMERWYNVEINLADSTLSERRLTGKFEKEDIIQALEALKITVPFTFDKKEHVIVIRKSIKKIE